ncbi:hypothetical protein AB675_10179 [Cyphellophora attinorum]|uniref:Uncharacterized protein n=1 Tax=Cyphellophora attinorum TaxID=1664694 RepID=A0A0N1HG30_9EURO|nr:hypothetical protein AB675_10179 [Phialophora attinorum]
MSYDQGGNGNWQNTDPNGNYYYNGAENNEFYDQDYASQQPEQQQGGEGYYDEYGQPIANTSVHLVVIVPAYRWASAALAGTVLVQSNCLQLFVNITWWSY